LTSHGWWSFNFYLKYAHPISKINPKNHFFESVFNERITYERVSASKLYARIDTMPAKKFLLYPQGIFERLGVVYSMAAGPVG